MGCSLFRRFGTAHTQHLVREVIGLPLTYIQNGEGDCLDDDDEAGRGVYFEIVLELWGTCGPVIRETLCETRG